MVYKWAEHLRRQLLPSHCTLCLANDPSGLNLCPDCRSDLPWLRGGCPRCALPLAAPDQACGQCQTHPSALDHCHALFRYAAPVDALVLQLKFGQGLHMARLFAHLLAERMRETTRPDCLIPVPLHPSRQRQRGFNQAIEIARPLARAMNCRMDCSSCQRSRATPAQSLLPAAQRRRNLRGAFNLRRPLEARHVVLIDDVMTTGSTLKALAELLRENGVERVDAWVCARTVPGHTH